ncbi:hypothetical protein predicted by Glimmer/Critica [Bdellovibrio bacteriovorus HD100]|uniref:Uncharacterized protein n=1 Tax=Bdellovibrio bacteriovorus (strain ATCC 15356 / DSM 50701 / NCIMB 9529 / HD100) TaxID=264462 RepID=Q6MIN9_BDEBA|nr:hypothetical protein predicted by Glimmer/Critica [Bdellovibrio bacteriovorus HD100]
MTGFFYKAPIMGAFFVFSWHFSSFSISSSFQSAFLTFSMTSIFNEMLFFHSGCF